MQKVLIAGMLLAVLALPGTVIRAQAPVDSKPASTNVMGAAYPRVFPDGRVAFRVVAPDAQKVQVAPLNVIVDRTGYNGLGKAPFDMTKDSDGAWVVTTPPAVPGLHYYYVVIDGASFNDPGSVTIYANNRETSAVDVPEPGVDFYLPKDVPHGQVRIFWNNSKITGQWRRIFVYTPPGYDTHPQQRYPVLYLRHGGTESERGWVEQGHMSFILDNLLAAKTTKPMIVVMENGYAERAATATGKVPVGQSLEMMRLANELTTTETVPAIDANFRTIPDRDHRAIAGLSMGAAQTLWIAVHNQDKFSAIGAFSRPLLDNFDVKTAYDGGMADTAAFNNKMHLLWYGAGTAETGIFNSVKDTRAALDKAGIKYKYVEYPGLSHEWQSWRKQLNDFAPLLFQW